MSCYNSLAADRHADEIGALEQVDQAAEREREESLEEFMAGSHVPYIETDDLLLNVWTGIELAALIEQAWASGDYQELGSNIEELIRDRAKSILDDTDIETVFH